MVIMVGLVVAVGPVAKDRRKVEAGPVTGAAAARVKGDRIEFKSGEMNFAKPVVLPGVRDVPAPQGGRR